jgi:hypothetical protein
MFGFDIGIAWQAGEVEQRVHGFSVMEGLASILAAIPVFFQPFCLRFIQSWP